MRFRLATLFSAMCLLTLVLAGQALAQGGNRQLMSEKMAKADLTRNIMESVIGFKVKSESELGLTEDPRYQVDTKAAAVLKGVKVDKMIYDKERDIALAFGHIELGDIVNVLGELRRFKDVRVESFGFGTTTETSRVPLRALRAAMINAYDQIAEALVGQKLLSTSRVENYILTKDSNRSKVCAAVFGAYIVNPELNSPSRGWGWDESGNAFVKMEIDARKVRDMLGNIMVFKGENIISVVGRGASKDDLAETQPGQSPQMIKNTPSKTQSMDLNVPTGK